MSSFSNWLLSQLSQRNMSQSDLARLTGLTRQTISYYVSGKSKEPDRDALLEIARVFKLPKETVYRAAGLIDQKSESDPWAETMVHRLSQIRPGRRRMAERFIQSLLEDEEAENEAASARDVKTSPIK